MADTVTYGDLRRRAKERADMTKSKFVTDETWLDFINASTKSLYNKLVGKNEDYYIEEIPLETNGIDKKYRLPDNFFKFRGLDYTVGGFKREMHTYTFNERNRNQTGSSERVEYRIVGSNIIFQPTPKAQVMTLWIIPGFTPFARDDDEFDGINGWEEYVVIDAAIKARIKEESDTSELRADLAMIERQIEELAAPRNQASPERIVDVSNHCRDEGEW